jgi:hypothetical protein
VGREAEARSWPEISLRRVSPSYFRAVSLPLVRGRLLLDSDTTTAAPVVLINEAAAQQFFPSGDPIGARMRFWGTSRTIVGVVANERFHGVTAPPPIATYAPLAQAPSASGVLLLRTAQQPSTLSASAERVIHEIDPALAVFAGRAARSHRRPVDLAAALHDGSPRRFRPAGPDPRRGRHSRAGQLQRRAAAPGDRHPHGRRRRPGGCLPVDPA